MHQPLTLVKEKEQMTLTKTQIVDEIHQYMFWDSRKKTVDLVETLLEIMKRTLESGDDLLISNFGKFCVKEKSGRNGRNPATGEEITIKSKPEMFIPRISFSSRLKEKAAAAKLEDS